MCGRYGFVPDSGFSERFGIGSGLPPMQTQYNAAPTATMPVVVRHSPNSVELMRWGLVPSWADDPSIGNRMINARAETLGSKPAFKRLLGSKRCLVPANGFYEWKSEGKTKQPFWFSRKDSRYIAFAGLYDEKQLTDGAVLITYTIITTKANPTVSPVHDRMPVILGSEGEETWLDPDTATDRLTPLLLSSGEDLTAYPVSRRVNDASQNSPDLIRPLE